MMLEQIRVYDTTDYVTAAVLCAIPAAAIIYAIYRYKHQQARKKAQPFYCPQCEAVGPAPAVRAGSGGLEFLLWCFFLLPGLLYSGWRDSNKRRRCANCGSEGVIPVDSPRAQREMKRATAA